MGFPVIGETDGLSASRLPATSDNTDSLRLDGYRFVTFRVQWSNNNSRETRDGEGRINFLLSFSYAAVARVFASLVPFWNYF